MERDGPTDVACDTAPLKNAKPCCQDLAPKMKSTRRESETAESRRPDRPLCAVGSKERADAVADAAEQSAANGTRHCADAADRRTTQAASYAPGQDRATQFLPEAASYGVQIIDRKLMIDCIVVHVVCHSHFPFSC